MYHPLALEVVLTYTQAQNRCTQTVDTRTFAQTHTQAHLTLLKVRASGPSVGRTDSPSEAETQKHV